MTTAKKPYSPRYILYRVWAGMHDRCYNPKAIGYKHYGGKGVKVCKRWHTFDNFKEDMGFRPEGRMTLDRKDGTKDYSPDNCKWSTYDEQIRNRNMTRWITRDGETMCLKDWTRRLGLRYNTIQDRIKKGWLPELALTIPISADNAQFRLGNRAKVTGGKINYSVHFPKACIKADENE